MSTIFKLIGSALNGISYISPTYASKKALDLFATPRKGKITEDQLPLLESAFKNEITEVIDKELADLYKIFNENLKVLNQKVKDSNIDLIKLD